MASPTPFARRPFKRLTSPKQYNARLVDQQFINVEQAMPPYGMRVVTSDTTATALDQTIAVDASDGPVTVTFPAADRAVGLIVSVVKTDDSANAVTIGATTSGVTNPTLTAQYASRTIQSSGSTYLTLASI